MAKVFFKAGSTWRKLGYALNSDSLTYREIIENNPQWDVTEYPPVGTELRVKTPVSETNAGLSQQSPIVSMTSSNNPLAYYPFYSRESYLESALRYSAGALKNVESLNGWSQNSVASDTGLQG